MYFDHGVNFPTMVDVAILAVQFSNNRGHGNFGYFWKVTTIGDISISHWTEPLLCNYHDPKFWFPQIYIYINKFIGDSLFILSIKSSTKWWNFKHLVTFHSACLGKWPLWRTFFFKNVVKKSPTREIMTLRSSFYRNHEAKTKTKRKELCFFRSGDYLIDVQRVTVCFSTMPHLCHSMGVSKRASLQKSPHEHQPLLALKEPFFSVDMFSLSTFLGVLCRFG